MHFAINYGFTSLVTLTHYGDCDTFYMYKEPPHNVFHETTFCLGDFRWQYIPREINFVSQVMATKLQDLGQIISYKIT
jgi:hypothetical protein